MAQEQAQDARTLVPLITDNNGFAAIMRPGIEFFLRKHHIF